MITRADLAAIKTRLAVATPGRWVSHIEGRDHDSGSNFIMTGVGARRGPDIELSGATNADQDFIAHAHQDMEVLIDALERLMEQA